MLSGMTCRGHTPSCGVGLGHWLMELLQVRRSCHEESATVVMEMASSISALSSEQSHGSAERGSSTHSSLNRSVCCNTSAGTVRRGVVFGSMPWSRLDAARMFVGDLVDLVHCPL